MSVSRSSTIHVKSPRSPAQTRTPSSASTPRFMPPSHYAAAGGYAPRKSTHHDIYLNGEHVRQPAKDLPTFSAEESRNKVSGGSSSRKSAAPPASSDSESLLSNIEDHVPDLSLLQKRQSIKNGYPELEPQLLPSLRDTIDRMTGSSRMSKYTAGRGAGDGEKEKRGIPVRGPPVSRTTPQISELQNQHINNKDSAGYRRRATDDTPTMSYSYQSTPTQESLSSRLKTPTKSVLKSSFRSPSKTPVNITPTLLESFPSAAGSSLKSMKTLLTRKCSGRLRSPFNGNKSRSEKDSRNEHQVSSPLHHENPDAMLSNRHHASRHDFQSNIPRFRTRVHCVDPNKHQNDDSDFEHRLEVESRDRRKLTVTNAEVFVSESSSESDAELRHYTANNSRAAEMLRSRYIDSGGGGSVGLGLSLPRAPLTPKEAREHRSLMSRTEENRLAVTPEKNLRFSLPPSNSAESSYSDEFGNYIPQPSRVEARKLSPSLASRVSVPTPTDSGFERHPPNRFSFAQYNRNYQDIDATYPSRNFSRSSSQSPSLIPSAIDEYEDNQSEREGYSIQRATTQDRRRSSSCTPLIRSSPGNSNPYDNNVPSRPKSACQRYSPQEGMAADREFPQSLKDLIKQRNSFSKPPMYIDPRDYRTSAQGKRSSTHEHDRRRSRQERRASKSPQGFTAGDTEAWPYHSSPRHSREHQTGEDSDTEIYRSAAARERLAFGIPPSESDEVFSRVTLEPELPHVESDMSSINECIRRQEQEYEDDSDLNADSILQKLDKRRVETGRHLQGATPRLNVISPTTTSESLTRGERETPLQNSHSERALEGSHSRPIKVEPYSDSGKLHPIEAPPTREGVIQEIFETEEKLVHLLRICIRLFIIPLRVQNSRTWISGVPPIVARLLDWFDDIVHLHEQVYEALCSARDTMSPATDRVSEALRWFVLRVEVYQPYLVRLADVKMEIRSVIENRKSELGQFIRLQEKQKECQGWTLEQFLMLPVNRLASYQDLFARMLDLTPKTHQDYLSTLSLSRSTDIALKVMTEVKVREDEYDFLKAFASRIQGLPPTNLLATRERRLLHSGPLQLVISNLHDLSVSESSAESKRISRSSKLLDVIGGPNYDLGKLSSSSSPWMTGGKDQDSANIISGPAAPSKASWFSRLPLRRRSRAKSPTKANPVVTDEAAHIFPDIDLRTVDVYAFVFNDVVLLAQQGRSTGPEPNWILSEDLGIFRPLSIARIRRRNAQEGMILSLEAAVIEPQGLNDTFDFRTSSWRIVDLLVPPSAGILDDDDHQVNVNSNDYFQPWLNSLRQCCKAILRKLTFVDHHHHLDQEGFSTSLLGCCDRLLDTHRVVSSLTASGLPIPRSPSGNPPETFGAMTHNEVGYSSDEREERGWWSLRYQQVFREFQRQDSLLFEDGEE